MSVATAVTAWERLFHRLAEAAPEGICTVDAAGRVVYASVRLGTMLGRDPEQMRGRAFEDLVEAEPHGLKPPATREGRALLFVRADGSRFWASVATVAGDAGGDSVHLVTDLSRRLEGEERLRSADARSLALFESNPHPMWIHDLETQRFLDVNAAAVRLYGYARDEFLGMSLCDIRVPDEAEALSEAVVRGAAALDLGGSWRHRAKDGTTLHVNITSHTIEHAGRRAECVLALDATSQRRSEGILQSIAAAAARTTGDEFFRSTVRHLAAVLNARWALVGALDPARGEHVRTLAFAADGRIAPDFEYDLRGTPCENVVGRGLCCYSDGVAARFPEDPLLAALGAESYLGAPLRDSAGNPVGILVVLNDRPMDNKGTAASILNIFADRAGVELERKRAEEALQRSEAAQRAVLAAMPDLLVRLAEDGTCLDVHAPPRFRGPLAPQEVVGCRFDAVLPAPAAAACRVCLERCVGTGEEQTFEYAQPLGVEERHWEVRIAPGGSGDLLAVIRDVTLARRLDERIRQAQRLEGLEVLAGGIAHDFNNLLAGIMGFAGLAQSHVGPDSPIHAYLRNIEVGAQRGAELTRQMLAYSGKGRFVTEEIHLNRLVEEMLHLLQTVLSKHATLQLDFARGLPPILGDATQIRQLIMNLITNASDAIGTRHGLLSIATGVRVATPQELAAGFGRGADAGGKFVFLEVTDDGCGMDTATRERLFDPFFTTKPSGRGLGLAAVRGIVRAHGGAILVESEPSRGAKFTTLFPARTASPAARIETGGRPADDEVSWRGEGTVLVVDDEEHIREIVRVTLEERGLSVLCAVDGDEAVRIFAEHVAEIRLVLLDMTMPRRSGADTLGALRRLRPDVPVIVMSGYAEHEIGAPVTPGAVTGFLRKPYPIGDLVHAVRRALEGGAETTREPSGL